MDKKIADSKLIIYQTKNGAIELKGDINKDTLWAKQTQISEIFGIDRTVVTKHIQNILKDEELLRNSVCAKFAQTAGDGKSYQVQFYNLDVILAVGYRTNSLKAIQFRKWATKTLKQHILEGFTINKNKLAQNYDTFLKAVEDVKRLLPASGAVDSESALELIKMFASTWLSLDAYDKDNFPQKGFTKKSVEITAEELMNAIYDLKKDLFKRNEASELFANQRTHKALHGIVGNIFQSFDGNDLYPSIEEKAAHLFYFIVKNHPFTDGNKRCGAFSFVWFLKRCKLLNTSKLSPEALTALTLLTAESRPSEKERMIGLILILLKK